METLEYDHNVFHRPDGGDDQLIAIFYMGVIHNDAKTEEAGRHIFDDVECVRIIIPGDKNNVIDRPAQASDKRRFAKQYAAFKEGRKEDEQISGTRLREWPFLSRAQCEELNAMGIKTVEQLAELRDDVATKVPGMVSMKRNAATWLGKSKSAAESAKITKLIEDQAAELATLKQVIKEMGQREEARLMERAKA
jgi:hypothetical protein